MIYYRCRNEKEVLTRSKLWKTKNFWMQENQKKLAEALTDKIVKF